MRPNEMGKARQLLTKIPATGDPGSAPQSNADALLRRGHMLRGDPRSQQGPEWPAQPSCYKQPPRQTDSTMKVDGASGKCLFYFHYMFFGSFWQMPIGGIRRSQCMEVPPAWPVVKQAGEVRGHIQRELRQRSMGNCLFCVEIFLLGGQPH